MAPTPSRRGGDTKLTSPHAWAPGGVQPLTQRRRVLVGCRALAVRDVPQFDANLRGEVAASVGARDATLGGPTPGRACYRDCIRRGVVGDAERAPQPQGRLHQQLHAMTSLMKFVFSPVGLEDVSLAIAASRAGAIGVYNAEFDSHVRASQRALVRLGRHAHGSFGIKLGPVDAALEAQLLEAAGSGLAWVVIDAERAASLLPLIHVLRGRGARVLAEVRQPPASVDALPVDVDGIVVKGNESGGLVGEDASFILLQKWLRHTQLPLVLRGGVTPAVAAACASVGVAGVVLDSQMLLMDEVQLSEVMRTLISRLSGSETVACGDGERGLYARILVRPNLTAARAFVDEASTLSGDALRARLPGGACWHEPQRALLPVGHDVSFAAPWRERWGTVGGVLRAIDDAVARHPRLAREHALREASPLAQALGVRLPIIQGPMTRVSDSPAFARAVSEGGALPMVALATVKGEPLKAMLASSAEQLAGKRWGIGLLGFAPQELLDEQLAAAAPYQPSYAIIAGGRPDQAVELERRGVPSFLHVPSANLVPHFLEEGARRFIFEGRECGGHIGPLSSFVLWSGMQDCLLREIERGKVKASELELIFAGGIHDDLSSAMLQVLVAPLAAAGCKVGVLMGSAYLFTREIVASGAIVEPFQREVLACTHTVALESGPGHASRCAYTPFAAAFFGERARMRRDGTPADEARGVLDDLILGRLRTASKGRKREGLNGELLDLDADQQREEGMYMLGQVATLRSEVTTIDALHADVIDGAQRLLAAAGETDRQESDVNDPQPADIAIVGIAAYLPQANDTRAYWHNILAKVDAITEIPSHRWDWRLYFDADRTAKDKVYSKWGGFLDDLPFDPTRYGMPPKSIESVDPMQLMGLEIAARAIADAGYDTRPFDRERASVILGASGGAGDFGMQYGLRSELPRFTGQLPGTVADRLPEWTEDSFAGILPNVAAGRIANRLNFGGMNMAVDAACASSLSAVYLGVNELAAGRSDFVVAGGIDTVQGPFGYLCFSKTQALSPRGRCFTFDAKGDGICISEGIAMVAMKRLGDAQRDGDRVYAVIKGVGSSSDGNAKGLTAPLPAGQLRAMRRAYAMAGFGPSTVGLFEAHGTGTVAGDTAELESTSRLIREDVNNSPPGNGPSVTPALPRSAVIGSVKTNIGHTKATAGVAGLVKAALALHHKVLPPHRNVTEPNAVLADPQAALYIVDEPMPWVARADRPRRAACSAFGFGGTNFHVVMQEYAGEYRDWMQPSASDVWPAELLVLGDDDRGALADRVHTLVEKISAMPAGELQLRDLSASLTAAWQRRGHTLALVARSVDEATSRLAAAVSYLRGQAKALPPGVYVGDAKSPAGKVAVLFSGQGSQYIGMGREAALHFDEVADALAAADTVLAPVFDQRFGVGARLSAFVLPRGAYGEADKAAAQKKLTSTDVAQPALGAFEAGLWQLMRSMGLTADMVAGHSYGEFVALHAAGAFDFDELMRLSAARGGFIVDAASAQGAELGTMAAVNAPRAKVEAGIAGIDGVVVANHNAPMQSIISGTKAGIEAASSKLASVGIEASPIPVAAAFHSALVAPAQAPLAGIIEASTWAAPTVPVYANTTGNPHAADVDVLKRAMAAHLTQPVEFVAQIEAMHADGARLFVEVGPKSVLTRLVGRILEGKASPSTAVALDDGSGLGGLLGGIAQLVCAGVDLDLARLHARRDCRVGNPFDPASLRPPAPMPRHAWMLNGSGARRAAAPVRQIGVTVESVAQETAAQAASAVTAAQAASALTAAQAASASTPAQSGRAAESTAPGAVQPAPEAQPSTPAAGAATPTAWPAPAHNLRSTRANTPMSGARPLQDSQTRRNRFMDERRGPPGGDAVLAEYFALMRQFIESQERVLTAYLGGDLGRASAAAPRTRPAMLPRAAATLGAPTLHVPLQSVQPQAVSIQPPVQVPHPVQVQPVQVAPAVHAAAPAQPAPVVQAAAAPPAAAQPKPAAAAEASSGGEALTRKKLEAMLLAIVEDRTGYPSDMVGMDQNLEADLGIDSIKRIEVVGAILQQLPAAHREALTESRSKLNTQPTLKGMVELIAQAQVGGAVAVPFEQAGTGVKDVAVAGNALPSRLIMRPVVEPALDTASRHVTGGRFVILRDDHDAGARSDTVADALAAALRSRGVDDIVWVEAGHRGDEAMLVERCAALSDVPIAGVIHLAALRAPAITFTADAHAWRGALWANERCFFVALRTLLPRLVDGAHVVAASDLGGLWGRDGTAVPELRCLGGSVGALKSLAEERPMLRIKAVDLDPQRSAADQARDLVAEIELDGGRQEVGYPAGQRTVFVSTPQDAPARASHALDEGPLVVLATGGARGITAEVLRTLARPGCTLVLTGRSAWPDDEPAETAALADANALRAFHVARVRDGRAKLTPGEIQRLMRVTIDQREMRANVGDLRAAGASVEYHAVDVTDETALRGVVGGVVSRHGAIHGVVHGAGVIEDKLVADKTSASWSRVVETKVTGLALLAKLVEPAVLKFFTVFASVAGRYGNSGQSDYATANELMVRTAQQLQARWGEQVVVSALCWGPWGATTSGAGMVTADTEAKFASKGVKLVDAALGRRLFRAEIDRIGGGAVEVVCGEADWDSHEARRAQVRWSPVAPTAPAHSVAAAHAASTPDLAPLLGACTPQSLPTGDRVLPFTLDPARDRYLLEHVIDGKMVLPAAAALEMMAEAAHALWPGWHVVEVREHRLLKGLEMTGPQAVQVRIAPPPYGSSEGFEVNASLQSPQANGRVLTHYRCVVRLEQVMPPPMPLLDRAARHDERALSVAKAYGEWLFHGPRFQVITTIDGLSAQGATARVRRSEPSQWLARAHAGTPDDWCFDPALIDAAAQMAWLWSRAYRDESALPTRLGRVARCVATLPDSMTMVYRCVPSTDATIVRGHVAFVDNTGRVVMEIEELDSIASAALNRLGGTARTAEAAT